jgi:outer membrane protein assembly factor BamB
MLLFIISSVIPMVIGYDVETANRELMDDLAFVCYDKYGSSKVSYYREYLLRNQPDNNLESDRFDFPEETDETKTNEIPTIKSEATSVGPMDSPWPMKCQNNRHTGLSPYSTEGNNGMVKWKYQVFGWMESGIAIDNDGVIYFGDHDRYFTALYPDGSLKWRYKTNGWIWSTPAIAEDGTIYIGSWGDILYAFHSNGTLKWEFSPGATISSSPAIAKDGTIYFGTAGVPGWGCRIYAVNPNGTEKWHYQTGNSIFSDPAIADDGTIYIGSRDSYLYAMNPDGTLKWRFKTGDYVKSHPSIADDGTIYFDSFDGYLYALNSDGTLKWTHGGGCACASSSIDEDGTIYIGGFHLTAIYPNGTRKWRFTFGGQKNTHHVSPAISSDGTIYVGVSHDTAMGGGSIYAINKDGTEKWQKKIANDVATSSPTIGKDGTVYIGGSSTELGDSCGYIYAFGRNDINQPPDPPSINGPTIGLKNKQHTYNFTLDDPELDDIELFVDWGDGNTAGWLGPFDSGETQTLTHSWSEKGTYTVKAKARDTYDGSESDWATLKVTMPKNKTIILPSLQFLENHPRMFPILRKIFD